MPTWSGHGSCKQQSSLWSNFRWAFRADRCKWRWRGAPKKNGSLGLSHPGIKSYLQILKSATCKCNRLETFTSKFGFRNYEPLLITGFPVNPRCRIMPWHWLQAGSHFHHNQRYHWCFPQHMQDHICEGWDRMFFLKNQRNCHQSGQITMLVGGWTDPFWKIYSSNWIMKPQGLGWK